MTGRSVVTHLIAAVVGGVIALYLVGWLAPAKPGGVWVQPDNGITIKGATTIRVKAYRTHPWDVPIHYVNITATWSGASPGPWQVLCHLTSATEGDEYDCILDPAQLHIPAGSDIKVSFDVYDWRRGLNLSPNGVHTIHYQP